MFASASRWLRCAGCSIVYLSSLLPMHMKQANKSENISRPSGLENNSSGGVDPARLVRIEAHALLALAERLEGDKDSTSSMAQKFARAVDLIVACGAAGGRVVVTGMGKSGIIAQKIAATLSSTGSPALFLHPAEAHHGDLGMLAKGDVVIALSASGETEEILRLLEMLKRIGDGLISFCCEMNSTLAMASDIALDCSVEQEACTLGLAPTASTTTMLALGDALAIAISARKGFRAEDFANLHPGGKLGKRLMRVEQLMHSGDAVPRVAPKTAMSDVIYEMSSKGLGITTVVEGEKLVGLLSDGDLRRLLEREGASALAKTAGDAMHRSPQTIAASELAAEALRRMEERKITSLIVVDGEGRVEGVIHLHDLWGTELF
ncbi:MAG: KpsF/GutQ family sugar-phosphate isomerase [Acidobacteriaceae bacterium]